MTSSAQDLSTLSGYAPAIPTPFDEFGYLDDVALGRFCDEQVQRGAAALLVCGTTGEAPTLTAAEQATIVHVAVEAACGKVPVIAGAGSNATAHAIELTKEAEAAGANAILSVVPYYNRPTQAGLYAHFREIAEATALPIFLYDVPARTACSLADETVERLARSPQFIGLKDAGGDIDRIGRLRKLVGPEFRLFSGDDATVGEFLARGGNGCFSVTSNVAPGLCQDLFAAAKAGDIEGTTDLAGVLAPLTATLFRETNPVPLKYVLSLLGVMSPQVRLPLVQLGHEAQAAIARDVAIFCEKHSEQVVGKVRSFFPRALQTATG